ncbi:MAG: hypothetical protein WAN03_06045, partial [Candidatus Sulfotelmatobacter sp.]
SHCGLESLCAKAVPEINSNASIARKLNSNPLERELQTSNMEPSIKVRVLAQRLKSGTVEKKRITDTTVKTLGTENSNLAKLKAKGSSLGYYRE